MVNNLVNPLQPSVAFHIETSHLFYSANQMAGFYMKYNTRLRWVNSKNMRVLYANYLISKTTCLYVSGGYGNETHS